jgi:hypothetical protein
MFGIAGRLVGTSHGHARAACPYWNDHACASSETPRHVFSRGEWHKRNMQKIRTIERARSQGSAAIAKRTRRSAQTAAVSDGRRTLIPDKESLPADVSTVRRRDAKASMGFPSNSTRPWSRARAAYAQSARKSLKRACASITVTHPAACAACSATTVTACSVLRRTIRAAWTPGATFSVPSGVSRRKARGSGAPKAVVPAEAYRLSASRACDSFRGHGS